MGADAGGAAGYGAAQCDHLERLGDAAPPVGWQNAGDQVFHQVFLGEEANGGKTDDLIAIRGQDLTFGKKPGGVEGDAAEFFVGREGAVGRGRFKRYLVAGSPAILAAGWHLPSGCEPCSAVRPGPRNRDLDRRGVGSVVAWGISSRKLWMGKGEDIEEGVLTVYNSGIEPAEL